ncbi:MAG: DEAD/DEAH box helicase [Alistipes sp.]|nr:DEAD/DEAH box helicase [Alistipes sp.]
MRYTDLLQYKDTDLRDYQQQHKEEVYQAWDDGCRSVMLQMPTGTGKTHLFVSIIKDFQTHINQCRVLVLAHRDEILNQICDTLYGKYGVPCGKIDRSNHSVEHNNILVASVQTMVKRLNVYEDNFDLIVVDEAHHTKATSYKRIIKYFPSAKVLGVTATPYRLSGDGFGKEYDKLILSETIKEYIKQGYLSDIKYLPTDIVIHNCDSITIGATGDYENEVLFKHMDNPLVYTAIIDAYHKYANNKKGIVYTINQEHNLNLQKCFEEKGIPSAAIDSKTPSEERKKLVERFKNSEINVLCNVDIFGEGFDCPDVDFILLARPTKSLSLYLQQVGRGLRKTDNKDSVLIIDCVGSYTRFGLPTKERDWQKHFDGEGKEIDYSPTTNEKQRIGKIREEYGLSVEIKEIQQNEDLRHLKDLFSICNAKCSHKDEFRIYGEIDWGYSKSTVREWINCINKIDKFIIENINGSFTSIFNTIDDELLRRWESALQKSVLFIRFNNTHRNRLLKPLAEYINFAYNIEQEQKQKQKRLTIAQIQQENESLLNDILAKRSDEITKEDIEVTLATMQKLKLSTIFDQKIESMKAILLSRYKNM